MESITIGQIVGAMGTITIITGFIALVCGWYKKAITDKFTKVNNKIIGIEERLEFVEKKRDEYEKEVDHSKNERMILMGGLLAALKGLHEMGCNDAVTRSIEEIEEYMMQKSHN